MSMQQCLDNIAKQPPPGNHYCPGSFCAEIQPDVNQYCHSHNLPADSPLVAIGPDGKCYCCCFEAAAAAVATPVEVEPGLYRRGDSLEVGDRVLSTGPGLGAWTAREVTGVGAMPHDASFELTMLGEFRLESGEVRRLIASCDHLFLAAGAGDAPLVPFARLRPGDRVRAADGGVAAVVLTSYVRFSGALRHFALGAYVPGGGLDGHLLNANGLVTADLAVQLAWVVGALPSALVSGDAEVPALGSAEFHARYDTAAYTEFVGDPSRWPPLCEVMPKGSRGWA